MTGCCIACGSEEMGRPRVYDVRREHMIGENRLRELLRMMRLGEEIPWYITVLCDECARKLGWRRVNKTPKRKV